MTAVGDVLEIRQVTTISREPGEGVIVSDTNGDTWQRGPTVWHPLEGEFRTLWNPGAPRQWGELLWRMGPLTVIEVP